MKIRTSVLKHPSGVEIETPIFIPSFSSKGFSFENKRKNKLKSDVCKPMMVSKQFLTESLLISAYDLYYEYILKPEEFVSTEMTFIDSGGYETSSSWDFSETRKQINNHNPWKLDHLISVIKKWPDERFPGVIVNYDNEKERMNITDQIKKASDFFSQFPNFLHDFLIKPERKDSNIKIESILNNVKLLKHFNIIGLTEKELGNSFMERMRNISKLRHAMDNQKVHLPLHIFGSLDPITSILYFLAGAEIFDGLTWLKYSYYEGLAIYTHNYSILNSDIGLSTYDSKVKLLTITNNIYYLEKLKNVLLNFQKTKDFKNFDELGFNGFGELIEKNYSIFINRLKL